MFKFLQTVNKIQNTKPIEKYHPYIVEFLLNKEYPINSIISTYLPETDFSVFDLKEDLLDKVFKGNKQLKNQTIYRNNFLLSELTDAVIRCLKSIRWNLE